MMGRHNACVDVVDTMKDNVWCLTMDFDKIYCFDRNLVNISQHFKPIIIKGTTTAGYESRAYIDLTLRNTGLIIYSGWLDKREDVEAKYTNLKVEVFAYINTAFGEIGHYSSKSPRYQHENVEHAEDGVYIPKHMVYNWSKWSKEFKCLECCKQSAHFHIRIKFNEPFFML